MKIIRELELDKQHKYFKERNRNRYERNKRFKAKEVSRSGSFIPPRNPFLQDMFDEIQIQY